MACAEIRETSLTRKQFMQKIEELVQKFLFEFTLAFVILTVFFDDHLKMIYLTMRRSNLKDPRSRA